MSRANSKLLILIPAFNEESRLPAVLERIAGAQLDCVVLVVDDASTDGTSKVAREGGAVVLRHRMNLGYGGALQTGYKYAVRTGMERLVQLDADGQHDPDQIPSLLAPVESDEADIVIGSRFLEATEYRMDALRSFGRKAIQLLARANGLKISDPTSGLQAMNRRAIELFTGDFYSTDYPDVDVLLVARNHKLRIREISVVMGASPRPSTLHGGLKSVWYAYKMLLSVFAAKGERPRSLPDGNRGP